MGLPIAVTLSSGETSDKKGTELLMLEPGPELKVLITDKGYDSDAISEYLIARKAESDFQAPEPQDKRSGRWRQVRPPEPDRAPFQWSQAYYQACNPIRQHKLV